MQAPRDENRIVAIMGVLDTDGVTPVPLCSDSITPHYLCVANGTTGTDHPRKTAPRDENMVPVAMAVSSADGVTPITLYANSLRDLLIQST